MHGFGILVLILPLCLSAPANVRTVVVTAPVEIVTVTQVGTQIYSATSLEAPTSSLAESFTSSAKTTSLESSAKTTSLESSLSTSLESSLSTSLSTSSSSSVPTPGNSYYNTMFKVWQRFWGDGKWNDNDSNCNDGYTLPVLWTMAVLGEAIVKTGDVSGVEVTLDRIMQYYDSATKAFSASPNDGVEVYSDDIAQLAWVFIDAFKMTGQQKYLDHAKDIVLYIQTQQGPNGGIIWKKDKNYIASISTVEAALAAVRLYDITRDNSLLEFATDCMDFMFKNLQDPQDKLFFDGTDKNDLGQVDKGKLTYTIGCSISTLVYLHKFRGDQDMLDKALELASAATNPGGAFYDGNGNWNNNLEYVHLLFAGFADAFRLSDSFGQYRDEVVKQGNYIYQYLQDPKDSSLYFTSIAASTRSTFDRYSKSFRGSFDDDDSVYCNNDPSQHAKKKLLVNASAVQILYFMANY
ncbi:putative alpha-1,6-mannanase [Candida albicans P75010]|nr:putative alpha-1,6-mannanase [Candida albicans P75010]